MAVLGARAVGIPSFLGSQTAKITQPPPFSISMVGYRLGTSRRIVACSTVQESSAAAAPTTTATTTSTAAQETIKEEAKTNAAPEEAVAKPKRPAKAPAKPLPQLMEEEVMPSLLEILRAQEDLSGIELTFQDNRLEGSFAKQGNQYIFWAFFPTGDLSGPKGFSLSSYGSPASTVEPFLVDEKKISGNQVVFWVEKRLAAQGIIPVWKE